MLRSWRRTTVLAGVAGALVLGTGVASGAASGPPRTSGGLTLVQVKQSLLGTHTWYQQTYRGLPVLGGYLARHTDKAGRVTSVDDGRLLVAGALTTKASVAASAASARAATAAGPVQRATLSVLPGRSPRLVWSVLSQRPDGSAATLVDARTGAVLSTERLAQDAFGTARVFRPNPVVALHDETLTDRHDRDYAALRPAYRTLTLTNLDASGYLRGDFARVVPRRGQPTAYSARHRYLYDRSDDRFEAVMSYNDVTTAQRYIQSLGFTDVNNESQVLLPNQFSGDNSFYDPSADTITLGTGGVDDAEDDEVTWHEYGHAIQDDQVPGFGRSLAAGSIGEGFGDYWAVTMSEPISPARNLACVADWDSVSYTSGRRHCLRRVDENLTMADRVGEVHADGQIWSRALWDIHRALGRVRTDRLVLEAQFSFSPRTSFAAAAHATVATARRLYGPNAADVATRAFAARGIL